MKDKLDFSKISTKDVIIGYNYFKNKLLPFIKMINDNNISLNEKELKKLETVICKKPYDKSPLYFSLIYDKNNDKKINLLQILTEKILVSESFISKIIDTCILVKQRIWHFDFILDFNWVFNLS